MQRDQIRAQYARLKGTCEAFISLSASGAAPRGLRSSGDPVFAVPASLLGVPSISLPAMMIGNMPRGLQVIGFERQDANLFGIASLALQFLCESGSRG
jgi:Asp-tRNA(Asn)/Glu-tRNA(Gln) amidotransferase A subunit family amidase